MTPILACASHLLVDLPLFGGPVVMVAAGLYYTARRERRGAEDPSGDQPPIAPA